MLQHVTMARMVILAQTTFNWQVFIGTLRFVDNKLDPLLATPSLLVMVYSMVP
jgi:hypothetical protein